jgi:hypothetical protein
MIISWNKTLLVGLECNGDKNLRVIYAESPKDKGQFAETSGVSKN